MPSYKTKLLNKINTRNASILFIGQNEFSQKLCIGLASHGFQTYFYSDSTINDIEMLMNSGVHITKLVYDIYDADIVVISKPTSVDSDSLIVDYLEERLEILKLVLHDGMLFIVDEAFCEHSKESISDRIKMLAYLDPAEPVLEIYKDEVNYFYCEVNNSNSIIVSDFVKAKNNDSYQLGVELIKGAR